MANHTPKIQMLDHCILDLINAEPEVVCKDVLYHLEHCEDAYRRNEREAAELLAEAQVLFHVAIRQLRDATRLLEISQEDFDHAVAEYERSFGGR